MPVNPNSYDRNHVREIIVELDRGIGDEITFSIGCDVHLSYDNVEDALLHPQRYTVAAKKYLLVELSDYGIPPQVSGRLLGGCSQLA
jgi:protein-tyrosine phosphatase